MADHNDIRFQAGQAVGQAQVFILNAAGLISST